MTLDAKTNPTLHKCEGYKKAGIWPHEPTVSPRAWLNNFTEAEKEIASILLDHFVFYSNQNSNLLLRTTYQAIADEIAADQSSLIPKFSLKEAWITRVLDENPNVTDSGHIFCARARKLLKISEDKFLEPNQAVQKAAQGDPVIFVDDFVGSGTQMTSTWSRRFPNQFPSSFAEAQKTSHFPAIYLTLVAARAGADQLKNTCPGLHLRAGHILSDEYSIMNLYRKATLRTIPKLHDRIYALLSKYGPRLLLKDYMNEGDYPLYGFEHLGLLLAFEHGVPDATVPIMGDHQGHGWEPLVRTA